MAGKTQRILVVKLADLGDVLICEPALRSLRLGFPDAEIDVLVPPSSADIVEMIDHGTSIVEFPKHAFDNPVAFANPVNLALAAGLARQLRRRSYDAVVLLHHLTTIAGALKFRALTVASGAEMIAGLDNGRGTFLTHRVVDTGFGQQHETEYMLAVARAAGGAPTDPRPRLAHQQFSMATDLPTEFIAIFPATGPYSSARTWSAERYAGVANSLRGAGWPVVVVGGDDARDAARVIQRHVPDMIDLSGKTSLRELAAVVQRASVLVGGDSFIGHVASAMGRPVVSIFGPSNVNAWRPYGSVAVDEQQSEHARGVAVRHPLPCEPCMYTGYSLGRPTGCPTRTCLTMVSVEMVVNATLCVLEAERTWGTEK